MACRLGLAAGWFGLAAGCSTYDDGLIDDSARAPDRPITSDGGMGMTQSGSGGGSAPVGMPDASGGSSAAGSGGSNAAGSGGSAGTAPPVGTFDPLTCSGGECWWSQETADGCRSAGAPTAEQRPSEPPAGDVPAEGAAVDESDIYLGWSRIRLGAYLQDGTADIDAWQGFGLDLDGTCTNSADCAVGGAVACKSPAPQLPFDGQLCRDNTFARLQPVAAMVPEIGANFGIAESVFNCELWRGSYNIVTKISGYNGQPNDPHVRVDF
ncbi:MAG TPA: hypothetical protein VK509_20145, partial [Polyangiales bacterium]|nr:hypothetical protein [Polyangiales bacterium]